MHRIDGPGATVGNKFTEGDPVSAVPATQVTDDWLNAVQEEITAVILSAGITLNKANNAQLLAAITQKITSAIPASPPDASTTVKGLIELATNAETQAGTDSSRAITPAGLSSRVGTESAAGILQLATQAEAVAGTESSKALSAIRVHQAISARLAAEYSAQYTIAPGSLFAITHSKGIDASVDFVFVCLTADVGYSPGDEFEMKDWRYTPLNQLTNFGVFITSRTAAGFVMAIANGTSWVFPHKTTATQTAITVSRWAVKARIKP